MNPTAAVAKHHILFLLAFCCRLVAALLAAEGCLVLFTRFAINTSWIPPVLSSFSHPALALVPAALQSWEPWPIFLASVLEASLLFETSVCLVERRYPRFVLMMCCGMAAFFPLGTVLGATGIWAVAFHWADAAADLAH